MLRSFAGGLSPLKSIGHGRRNAGAPMAGLFVVLAASVAGCAKDPAPSRFSEHRPVASENASRVAGRVYYKVDIEDDGLEGQHPPLRTKSNQPDDPTEPFSPNYGRVRPAGDVGHLAAAADDAN